jgi:3',5'-cyclic AMP phosphodiesterase CpdA
MTTRQWTRRRFLRAATYGTTAVALLPRRRFARASNSQPFHFVQMCDTQLGFGGYDDDVDRFSRAVAQINALNPDFVVICGDLVNTANEKSFSDFKRIKDRFQVPCHSAAGNHDLGNQPTTKSLKFYRETIGNDYFHFVHQGFTFVIVNTQLWKAPVQEETARHDTWLRSTLASARQQHSPVVIVGHYPLFLKTPEEDEEYMNLPQSKRHELLELYQQNGVVAVLGGHTHRLLVNSFQGVPLVNGETTSRNFDQRPFGFRHWHVAESGALTHEFVPLTEK